MPYITGDTWVKAEPLATPHYAYRIGDARVHVLAEGQYLADPAGVFGKSGLMGPGKEAAAARAEHIGRDGCLVGRFMYGAVLLQVDGKNVLLDSCLGEVKVPVAIPADKDGVRRPPYPLLRTLRRCAKVEPEDIDFVVHSHLHPDHIGWNMRRADKGKGELVPTFPRAKHVVQRAEWDWPAKHFACPWREHWEVLCAPLERLGMVKLVDGDVGLLPSVALVKTAGHTPGHQCVRLESAGRVALYLGDALHTVPQVTWPEFCPVFDCCCWSDKAAREKERPPLERNASVKARRELLRRAKAEDAVLISPHLPFPGIGRLAAADGGRLRWEPLAAPARPPRIACLAWCCGP